MAVNLHEICRLCLEEIKISSTSLKEGSSLLTKLRKFLPLFKVQPGDGLPTMVCDQCESLVNICYNFKVQVERSESALQKYCVSQQFSESSTDETAGSSYQDGIECAVGVHLLAPLGISNTSPDHRPEQEHSSHEQEENCINRENPSLQPALHASEEICGCIKDFKPHHFLDIHQNKSVLAEKPYMCAYCGQSFRYMSSLTRHMVVHSGEKRYVCHICNKAFTQEAHLKTHSVLHTGEKPFTCTMCPMAFSRKGNLKRHLLVHKRDP